MAGDPDLAVLHVLGMNEIEFLDHAELFEQYGAGQAVEIVPRDQAELGPLARRFHPLYLDIFNHLQERGANCQDPGNRLPRAGVVVPRRGCGPGSGPLF